MKNHANSCFRKQYKVITVSIILNYLIFFLIEHFQTSYFFGSIRNYTNVFPITLLAILCGSDVAIFACLLASLYTCLTVSVDTSSVFLAAQISSLMFCNIVRRKYIYKPKKLILYGLYFSVILGITMFLQSTIYNRQYFSLQNLGYEILSTLPFTATMALIAFLFYRFMPPKILALFPNGLYFLSEEMLVKYGFEPQYVYIRKSIDPNTHTYKPSKLSKKIAVIIATEAFILALLSILFSSFLFSEEYYQTQNLILSKTAESMKKLYDSSPAPFAGNRDEIVSRFTTSFTLLFVGRLFLLSLNYIIPLVIFTNKFAQRSIAVPIRLMATAMDDFTQNTIQVKQKSMLNIHLLGINTNDEMGDLYKSLRANADHVTEYIKHLQNEQKLQEDLRVAKRTSDAKSIFLSKMSHEIRTPINAVLGLDEMILRESSEEFIRNYAMDIKSAGRSLLSIINDILDFSKIESGKMELIPVEYDLSSLINDLVNMISSRAEAKNIDFIVDISKEIPSRLYGDEIRIKQCALNILTNAVKYTQQGSVTMRMNWEKLDENHITLIVQITDTGIGIKEEDLPKLFHAFERIEEKRNRTIEGTGLGMNIVQQLLSLMDSHIEVSSVYGKGSDFSFRIKQEVRNWAPVGDYAEAHKIALQEAKKYQESFQAPDAHILVVDDTQMNLTVIKGLIKPLRIQIDTAESGAQGIKLASKQRYDIIFLDHLMPEIDGIEALHKIKTTEASPNKDTVCIALTANAISGARDMYLKEGFTDYLSKPIDVTKLESMLHKYIEPSLILHEGQAGYIKNNDSKQTIETMTDEGSRIFQTLFHIDIKKAIKNCASEEIFMEAVKTFHSSITPKAELIEQLFNEKNIKDYTIQIHALKSSARLIGANELSQLAKQLEDYGNNNDYAAITEKTPELLTLYKSYINSLAPLCGKQETQVLPPISKENLLSGFKALQDVLSVFDFDSADDIIRNLEGHTIPKEYADSFNDLKKKIQDVDQIGATELIKSLLS